MSDRIQTFHIADARTFDGDPFEVAERAVRQASAVTKILTQTIADARLMARNAQLERELLTTGECDAPGYEDSPEARTFDALSESVAEVERKLGLLARSVAFNPRAPLGPA